jgi:hypothetical protein
MKPGMRAAVTGTRHGATITPDSISVFAQAPGRNPGA